VGLLIGPVDGSQFARASILVSANPIHTTKIDRLSDAAMSSTVFSAFHRDVQ
jgi:hypothetical protein